MAGAAAETAAVCRAAAEKIAADAYRSRSDEERQRLGNAARQLAVAFGIFTDKAQLLTGGVTSRAERIDANALVSRLERAIDTTTTESSGPELTRPINPPPD